MTASLCGIPGWLLSCCSSFIPKARSRSRGTEGHSSPARVTWQQEVSACGAGGFLAVPASHFRLLLIKTLSPRPAGEAFTKIESNASLRLQWKFWAAKCKPHALVCSGVTAGLLPKHLGFQHQAAGPLQWLEVGMCISGRGAFLSVWHGLQPPPFPSQEGQVVAVILQLAPAMARFANSSGTDKSPQPLWPRECSLTHKATCRQFPEPGLLSVMGVDSRQEYKQLH